MKTVGIIGGLGPETTAKFNLEIISSCFKTNKENRPPMLSWNVPISLKTEQELITQNKSQEQFLPLLIDAAKRLEAGGADFLVMPCNSMHIFIEEIRNTVRIPMLSIVDETVKTAKNQKALSVGILATFTTLKSALFQKALRKSQIKFKVPEPEDQKNVDRIILKILTNRHTRQDVVEITKIVTALETKTLILACTDLQLIVPQLKGFRIIDTMGVLAKATAREILKGGEK